jgi:hypothetical protein
MTEQQVRRKHRDITDADWKRLGEDDVLIAAIELEKAKRIRSGANPREKARMLFAAAPDGLGASPRHRIESAKELRAISANGPEAISLANRFIICPSRFHVASPPSCQTATFWVAPLLLARGYAWRRGGLAGSIVRLMP